MGMALTPEELKELSPEELARLARDATVVESEAIAYASSLQVTQAGNDAVISFARPRPLLMPTGEVAPIMKAETTAIVYVSVQTLKDFYLALKDTVEKYEKVHGRIVTDYSKQFEK